jgi:SAM-dependent methyltransferase
VSVDAMKMVYFARVAEWPAVERRALRWVHGRVLDAGVGAGRAALELQRRGRSVVGIDVSLETQRASDLPPDLGVACRDVVAAAEGGAAVSLESRSGS